MCYMVAYADADGRGFGILPFIEDSFGCKEEALQKSRLMAGWGFDTPHA